VFRVVLPLIAAAATNRLSRGAVAIPANGLIRRPVSTGSVVSIAVANVVAIPPSDVRVPVEVVVVIDVDIIVATPAAAPTPTAAPERAHHHANAERDRHSGGVVSGRWIVDWWVRVDWRAVYHDRII
jgi:hypothetical protein